MGSIWTCNHRRTNTWYLYISTVYSYWSLQSLHPIGRNFNISIDILFNNWIISKVSSWDKQLQSVIEKLQKYWSWNRNFVQSITVVFKCKWALYLLQRGRTISQEGFYLRSNISRWLLPFVAICWSSIQLAIQVSHA